jgi:hypothetical protein
VVADASLQTGRSEVRVLCAFFGGESSLSLGSGALNDINFAQRSNNVSLLAIESESLGRGLEVLSLSLAIVDVDHIERIRVLDAENIRDDPNGGPYRN